MEIGCGSGFMTNQINQLKNFKKIHLIDISKKMISKAKKNLSKEKFSYEVEDFDNFKNYKIYDFIFQICHYIGQKIFQNFFFIY